MGRKSDNRLFNQKMNWSVSYPLEGGIKKLYDWIDIQVKK